MLQYSADIDYTAKPANDLSQQQEQQERTLTPLSVHSRPPWFDDLDALGLGDTWGVWDLIDGGDGEENSYGDVQNDGTALTPKGALHRARALSAPSPSLARYDLSSRGHSYT